MNTIKKISAGIATTALLLTAVPAFAQSLIGPTPVSITGSADVGANAGGARVSASVSARITTAKSHADQEIERRITALNDMNTKVQAMVRLSADEKTSISTAISNQISTLTTLKAKIDADTDLATLKTDIKSITASYRIFVLIIPQGRIEVAADKIATAVTSLTTLAGKLQTRIADAQAAGKDTASLSASLSDMNTKLADANVQASAAASEVANLTPDNGDKTKMQSNDQALKDARAKIQVALKDLATARQDAGSIVTGLKDLNVSGTTSVSGSTQ